MNGAVVWRSMFGIRVSVIVVVVVVVVRVVIVIFWCNLPIGCLVSKRMREWKACSCSVHLVESKRGSAYAVEDVFCVCEPKRSRAFHVVVTRL